MATDDEIKKLAYAIWEDEGRPSGKEQEHYFRAKQMLEQGAAASALAPTSGQAYCVKCRTKREIQSPHLVRMKNGRSAVQGVCPVCGTKLSRINKTT